MRASSIRGGRMLADQVGVVPPGRQSVDRIAVDLEDGVEFRAGRPAAPATAPRRAVIAEDRVPLAELVAIDQPERDPDIGRPRQEVVGEEPQMTAVARPDVQQAGDLDARDFLFPGLRFAFFFTGRGNGFHHRDFLVRGGDRRVGHGRFLRVGGRLRQVLGLSGDCCLLRQGRLVQIRHGQVPLIRRLRKADGAGTGEGRRATASRAKPGQRTSRRAGPGSPVRGSESPGTPVFSCGTKPR